MPVPKHLVIIPDGNRRWAKHKKLPSSYGHKEGYERIQELIRFSKDRGISYITVWAFSTENWKRKTDEVGDIFNIISRGLSEIHALAKKERAKIVHIGRKDRISKEVLHLITTVEEETKHYEDFCLCLAIDYGGEDEIKRAGELLLHSKDNKKTIADFLDTTRAYIPNPDLIIRTGGEKRTSGFMPLQSAYAEWIFDERFFPDFDAKALEEALEEYTSRTRRFGK